MAAFLNLQDLILRLRRRVSETGQLRFTDAELVEQVDTALSQIFNEVADGGRDHALESQDFAISGLAKLGDQSNPYGYSIDLPEHVGRVRSVLLLVTEQEFMEISQIQHEGRFQLPNWGRGPNGSLEIRGVPDKVVTARLSFLRRWPPMHRGSVPAGATTTTMAFDSSPTTLVGRVVARDDIYKRSRIEFTSGSLKDRVVQISSNAGATVTFSVTLPSPPAQGDTYSMVIPMDPEHSEYLVETLAHRLLIRDGNTNQIAAHLPLLGKLEATFRASLSHRDANTPKFMTATNRRFR